MSRFGVCKITIRLFGSPQMQIRLFLYENFNGKYNRTYSYAYFCCASTQYNEQEVFLTHQSRFLYLPVFLTDKICSCFASADFKKSSKRLSVSIGIKSIFSGKSKTLTQFNIFLFWRNSTELLFLKKKNQNHQKGGFVTLTLNQLTIPN